MTNENEPNAVESIKELRESFFYGSRSNLNAKFLRDLSDAQFGDFVEDLLTHVSGAIDSGDAAPIVDSLFRWQTQAYAGHLGDPADFAHRYEDTPFTPLTKPLSECRVAVMTSSGHFVTGDDPQPLDSTNMSQQEAEDRIGEFLKEAPQLSAIPSGTDFANLSVRHGGYPVEGATLDPQVVLPLRIMEELERAGTIGEVAPNAFSFVGAASQVRLKKKTAPEWAERMHDEKIDAVLLVPI